MANGTPTPTPVTNVFQQLWQLFLADEKAAVLPDVLALFENIAQNGITIAPGGALLLKALSAVEADALVGGQQFAKDGFALLVAWFQAQSAAAKFVKK